MIIPRAQEKTLQKLLQHYPILALTGPRQSGKSTLLTSLFPDYRYVNLEAPDVREFAEDDPRGFLQTYGERVIFDEVQNVPSLFSYLQVKVDKDRMMGQFILSGSSQFQLLEKITQSLSGRVSVNHLLPLSLSELHQAYPIDGGSSPFHWVARGLYPALFDRSIASQDYFADYVQTYLERDVRSLINVKDLKLFQTFLKLCAGRIGSVINYTSLGDDVGVSRETIKSWIRVLEVSYIAYELPPYFKNLTKRVTKSPKLYFYDTGLACYLLGLSEQALVQHPMRGGLFENMVINEYLKGFYNAHQIPPCYFYRDSKGLEIDLLIESEGKINAIEVKSSSTANRNWLKAFEKVPLSLAQNWIIYAGEDSQSGIKSWRDLLAQNR